MTLHDLSAPSPRFVCGLRRASWGTVEPLGCILDMNHEGRVHQDRTGRTWEMLAEYTTRAHHLDVVGRLVALLQGQQAVLERLTLLDSHELYMLTEDIANAERQRITATLVAMGLVDAEPRGEAA